MAKGKKTNSDQHNITLKTKNLVIWTLLKAGVNSGALEEKAVPTPHVAPVRVALVTNPLTSHKWGKDRIVITINGTYPTYCCHLWQLYSATVNQFMLTTVRLSTSKWWLQLNHREPLVPSLPWCNKHYYMTNGYYSMPFCVWNWNVG